MGNVFSQTQSNKSESKSFGHVIDYVASHYILTADFESLTKLYDEEYCNNMVILTADIINKNFNDLEITHLAQRLKNKEVVDIEKKEKVIFFNKQKLDSLDVGTKLKKKRICEGIAKFYVKIAHVFAAIITTINPVYTYNDDEGNLVTRPLSEKGEIPVNAPNRKLTKIGLCYNRINSLKYGQDFENIPESGDIKVHPKVCGINTNDKNLEEEPGIPELYSLYLDKYDYATGKFSGMQDNTHRDYLNDLKQFYKVFTGNEDTSEVGKSILRFSDIKLKDYQKRAGCQGANPPFTKGMQGSLKDTLFQKYALNLQKMVRHSNKVQNELLDIINDIFIYDVDPTTEKKLIRIKPTLNEVGLQNIVVKTRLIIINYYLTCETDFTKGVKLYEAIVENQIRITTESQIKSLDNVAKELTYTSQPIVSKYNEPVLQENQEDIAVAESTAKEAVALEGDEIVKEAVALEGDEIVKEAANATLEGDEVVKEAANATLEGDEIAKEAANATLEGDEIAKEAANATLEGPKIPQEQPVEGVKGPETPKEPPMEAPMEGDAIKKEVPVEGNKNPE